jgi:hypothetical protein
VLNASACYNFRAPVQLIARQTKGSRSVCPSIRASSSLSSRMNSLTMVNTVLNEFLNSIIFIIAIDFFASSTFSFRDRHRSCCCRRRCFLRRRLTIMIFASFSQTLRSTTVSSMPPVLKSSSMSMTKERSPSTLRMRRRTVASFRGRFSPPVLCVRHDSCRPALSALAVRPALVENIAP